MNAVLSELAGNLKRSPSLENTRTSPLALAFSFLIDGKDTNGQFSLLLVTAKRGAGPPMHVHSREDETFYILSGEVQAYLGDAVTKLGPGDTVFLPRKVPHTYQVISEHASFLVFASPAGFEQFFRDITEPATPLGLPTDTTMPGDPAKLTALLASYGVEVVGPPAPIG